MFIKTKLTVEVEVETQFGPADAVNLIENLTRHVSAVKSMKIVGIKTDYEYSDKFPDDLNFKAINNIPYIIKD